MVCSCAFLSWRGVSLGGPAGTSGRLITGEIVMASCCRPGCRRRVAGTLLAGVLPAVRASRVAPLAALRELAAEPARVSRVRSVLGFLLTAGGVGAVIAGAAGGGPA